MSSIIEVTNSSKEYWDIIFCEKHNVIPNNFTWTRLLNVHILAQRPNDPKSSHIDWVRRKSSQISNVIRKGSQNRKVVLHMRDTIFAILW